MSEVKEIEESDIVNQIVKGVRFGIRTKSDLKRCGCGHCQEALKRL